MEDRPLSSIRPSSRGARRGLTLAVMLAPFLALPLALAAPSPQEAQTQRATGTASAQHQPGKLAETRSSNWQRLSPTERQALMPLSSSWDQLSPTQRKKWLEISRNFPSLQPPEQAKMHERMREWALLNPEERARARLNFGKTIEVARELSPAEKLAKWQAYQALTPEQRLKLAEQARTRNLGAAPAAQPVPAQKLAVLPPPATARAPKPAEATEAAATGEEPAGSQ